MHEPIPEACARARSLLADSRERELAPEERDALDAHLTDCEACRSAASWLELADELAARAPEPEALSEQRLDLLVDAVMGRVEEEQERAPAPRRGFRNWAPALVSAAALVVVAAILLRSPAEHMEAPSITGRSEESALRKDAPEAETPPSSDRSSSPEELRQPQVPSSAMKSEKLYVRGGRSADVQLQLDEVAADPLAPWLRGLGEEIPGTSEQADSLRTRLERRLETSTRATESDSLRRALEELDRSWPQPDDSN